MLEDGVIAAQYLESWRTENKETVLVAPAHTFLMMNRPVAVQFWLDPGSSGWVQRLLQPLTQPYVLSRHWESGRMWMDADEVNAETESLARLAGGLLSRCREKLFLAMADLSETGFEQRGTLLRAFQKDIAIPRRIMKIRSNVHCLFSARPVCAGAVSAISTACHVQWRPAPHTELV